MQLNVEKELAALRRLKSGELRTRYAEVFGETTHSHHREWLVKRIIWRIQANAEGDLSQRARQRAAELANDADLRRIAPRSPAPSPDATTRTITVKAAGLSENRIPLPGTTLIRAYKGQTVQVRVLPAGFEFEGEIYKSLSAVAKKITGSHCNGYHFFRLTKQGGDR